MQHKVILVLTSVLALLASTMSAAGAQTQTTACGTAPAGYNVIESNARFIIGTTEKDFICAGDSVNTIRAKGKNDIIFGRGGNDIIYGGYGNDLIWGGLGNDRIIAGGGSDTVNAEDGDDIVLAGRGHDIVNGNAGRDTLTGGDGNDTLNGNEGDDIIIGNKGWDTLDGGQDNDTIKGGQGNDTIKGGAGNDKVNGGDHSDAILGGAGNDQLRGSNGIDTITGGDGDDAVVGGDGNDVLYGSLGNDTLLGGNGADELNAGAGNDTLNGGPGIDTLDGGSGIDNCINPDEIFINCELINGLNPEFGELILTIPTPYSVQVATPKFTVAGSGWNAGQEVAIEFIDPDAGSLPRNATVDTEGAFSLQQDFVGWALAEVTVTNTDQQSRTVDRAISQYTLDIPNEMVSVFGDDGAQVILVLRNSSGGVIVERTTTIIPSGGLLSWSDTAEDVYSIDLKHVDEDGDIELYEPIWRLPILRSELGTAVVEIDRLPTTGTTAELTLTNAGGPVETIGNTGGVVTFTVPLEVDDVVTGTINGTTKSFTIRSFAITGAVDQQVFGTGPAGAVVYGDVFESGNPNNAVSRQGLVAENGIWALDFGSEAFTATVVSGEIGVWDVDGDQSYIGLTSFSIGGGV